MFLSGRRYLLVNVQDQVFFPLNLKKNGTTEQAGIEQRKKLQSDSSTNIEGIEQRKKLQ